MLRRGILLGAVVMAVFAPVADARPTIVVQGTAVGVSTVDATSVRFQCSALDVTGKTVVIKSCSFGPLYAPPTLGPVFATTRGSGTLRLGGTYFLCVVAANPGVAGDVTRCASYDPLTGTAVVAG